MKTFQISRGMNTKLLLLMTAWCAAAPGTLMAQVNPVIESVTLTVPPGFCLLANHLDRAGGNTLNAVLPNVPEGSQVLKVANNHYTRDDFSIEDGGWMDAETLEPSVRTVNPGEGFFFLQSQCPGSSVDLYRYSTAGRLERTPSNWFLRDRLTGAPTSFPNRVERIPSNSRYANPQVCLCRAAL